MNHSSKFDLSESEFIHDESDDMFYSKSAAKRDADKLKDLAEELVKLSKGSLEQLQLDDSLRHAIDLAQAIQKEAKRRQLQYIGKYLRTIDVSPIMDRLATIKNKNNYQRVAIQKTQAWQSKLMNGDNTTIELFLEAYPLAERQQLKSLLRNAKKQPQGEILSPSQRTLYNYLKGLCDNI